MCFNCLKDTDKKKETVPACCDDECADCCSCGESACDESKQASSAKAGDETATVQGELDACKTAYQELHEIHLRLRADFDNFTRRIAKERLQFTRDGQCDVLHDLLAIIDDCSRALQEVESSATSEEHKAWLEGFTLIHKAMGKLLESYGVTPMTNLETFDPNYHEALMHVDSPDKKTGEIVAVLQQGYMVDDRVLRVAKVSVAK